MNDKTYFAEIYSGGVYCGNGEFNTLEKCIEFASDGFCDKLLIWHDDEKTIYRLKNNEWKVTKR